MSEIKVGDKVRIVNSGKIFSSYTEWLFGDNKNVITGEELGKYSYDRCPKDNDEAEYTVQCISPHEWSCYGLIAYVTSNCEGYIIGVDGLDYYKKKETKEESKTEEDKKEKESETEEDIINNFFANCQLEDIVKRIDSKVAKDLCIKIMKEKW